jgi:hypothetical protein
VSRCNRGVGLYRGAGLEQGAGVVQGYRSSTGIQEYMCSTGV